MRRGFGVRLAGPALGALLALRPAVGAAETLFDAIDLAYQTNPTLRAQRAELRATDEGYAQARAGYGPQVSVTGQYSYQDARVQSFSPAIAANERANAGSADLSLVQPLYATGALRAQVRGAADDVLAGRQALRQAESQLLQNVITAYVDVRRDRETIRVLRDEITALTGEFNEIKAKGALGAVTRTDVAQSEERLLSAQAQLNLSLGRLNASNAEYLNSVGQSPGELQPEPDLAGLPATVEQAFEAADHNNAQLLDAVQTERAAREKVNQAKAAFGPNVSLRLDASITPYAPYLQNQYDRSVTAAVVVTQPLFTSGLNSAKLRQALEEDNRAQLDIEATRRGVAQLVAQAWDQLVSTRSAMVIEQRQLAVETIAVEGNRVEERVGARTTIDLLNAELELAQTRLNLLQSRHDEYVARSALLSAMGLLETRFLTPAAKAYDPAAASRPARSIDMPWNGAVAALDGVAPPSRAAPRLSAAKAGAERPADLPPLPKLAP